MFRILFLSFSSFPISSRCSSLPSVGSHTVHFFSLQASIPPLAADDNADPSLCPAPTTLTQGPNQCQPKPLPNADNANWSLHSPPLSLYYLFVLRQWISLVSWWLLANIIVDDGFYFYFDEWFLLLLMVDEWDLLMVDEWWLGFSGWWMAVAVVVVVAMANGRGGCGWCYGCFWVVGYIIL